MGTLLGAMRRREGSIVRRTNDRVGARPSVWMNPDGRRFLWVFSSPMRGDAVAAGVHVSPAAQALFSQAATQARHVRAAPSRVWRASASVAPSTHGRWWASHGRPPGGTAARRRPRRRRRRRGSRRRPRNRTQRRRGRGAGRLRARRAARATRAAGSPGPCGTMSTTSQSPRRSAPRRRARPSRAARGTRGRRRHGRRGAPARAEADLDARRPSAT